MSSPDNPTIVFAEAGKVVLDNRLPPVPAEGEVLIHRDLPDEQAAFFTLGEIVMNGVRRSRLVWGESAIVFGLDLIGQLLLLICRVAGAGPVFGVDVAKSRMARLPSDRAVILNWQK